MPFKCIKGLAPPSLCNKFTTTSQVHTRILGIKISLIYHLLDQQQVSDLSHIGLLSSGMTFQKVYQT